MIPRVSDPLHTDGTDLAWLADWLALELPQIRTDDEHRALIARAVQLFARRGTPRSIAEFVELHTGIRPTIIEAFEGRNVWVLDVSSRLDFDTQLPPLDPLGWVVPDPAAATDCCETTAPVAPVCGGCDDAPAENGTMLTATTIGRVIVGEGGPLAPHQIGLPLFAEEAYRFCVWSTHTGCCEASTLDEIHRIVEREKPAHTDYRVQLIAPDFSVGLQARLGIDAIVGGEPPAWRARWRSRTRYLPPPRDAATRLGDAVLGNGTDAQLKENCMHPYDNAEALLRVLSPRRAATSTSTASGWTSSISRWSRTTESLKQWMLNRLTLGKGVCAA